MDVRNRLALALDVPDLDRAEQLMKEVAPWFGVAKVGLELYSAAGPEAVTRMRALDPRRVLERGYSITRDADGHVLRATDEIVAGALVETELASGRVTSRVESTTPTPMPTPMPTEEPA